ncbi:MAG: glyoxylase-like metal-dependent hydrolase (beta-lactamase superfamily II) [Marinoscillum sp.]|jgi:glyoxylase-like metal-dependent hydrolase (beta-lactamase superfamily II)
MYLHEPSETLIGGDVLFKGSIGRTDLPGGNHQQLLDNIKNKVYILPNDTVVYPGHGPETTIGEEKRTNPFIKG